MAVWVTQSHGREGTKVSSLELVPVLGFNAPSVPAQSSRWYLNWHNTCQGKSGLGKMLTPSEIISWGCAGAVLCVTGLGQFLPCTESLRSSSSDVKHHILGTAAWISTCRAVLPVKNLGLGHPDVWASPWGTSIGGYQWEGLRAGGTSSGIPTAWDTALTRWRKQSAVTKGFPSLGNTSHS